MDPVKRIEQLEWENQKLIKHSKDSDVDLSKLSEPFHSKDLEWRIMQAGITKQGSPWAKIVPYIQARAIIDRLNEVVGPQNWQNSNEITDKGILTTILIKINGEWVGKQDGSEFTEIEPFKGGISGGLKRAAVLWG